MTNLIKSISGYILLLCKFSYARQPVSFVSKNKEYSYKETLIKCDKTSGKKTFKYMINQKNKK